MTHKPPDPEIQRAAAETALSVAITETFAHQPDLGNDVYDQLYATWIRDERSQAWIDSALEAVDDIARISFVRDPEDLWVLEVEWREE
jgi:hypothetical protein